MKITGRLADDCSYGRDCPRIHGTDEDQVIVQGAAVTAAEVGLDPIPENEALVSVPRTLIYGEPLDVPTMLAWLDQRHTFDLFRFENQRKYTTASDGDDVARYHRGEPEPASVARDKWFAHLEEEAARGLISRKVHATDNGRLSAYEQYEFGWGFTGTTAHGEQVRVLDLGPTHEALRTLPDFFVLDRKHVLVSVYNEEGRLTGGQPVYGPHAVAYAAAAELIWDAAVEFADWWAAHPQYHRTPVA